MKEKVVEYEERCPTDFLQSPLVLHVVNALERYKLLQKDFTVMVLDLVVVAGNYSQCLCQIGFAAVRWPQDANIQAGSNELQG